MGVPESRTMPSIVPANNDEYSHETRPALRAIDAGVAFDGRSVGGREKAGQTSEDARVQSAAGTGYRCFTAAETAAKPDRDQAAIRWRVGGGAGTGIARSAERRLDASRRKYAARPALPSANASGPSGTAGA